MRGRALGGPTPPRKRGLRPRPRVSTELIHAVADVVTNRDKAICIDSFEHRFLTTRHIYQLHFSDHGRARHRLHRLYELRVLERFRPRRDTGSHPYHYVLDDIGMWITAAYLGCDPKDLAYDKRKALALVYSPHLLHCVRRTTSSAPWRTDCAGGEAVTALPNGSARGAARGAGAGSSRPTATPGSWDLGARSISSWSSTAAPRKARA